MFTAQKRNAEFVAMQRKAKSEADPSNAMYNAEIGRARYRVTPSKAQYTAGRGTAEFRAQRCGARFKAMPRNAWFLARQRTAVYDAAPGDAEFKALSNAMPGRVHSLATHCNVLGIAWPSKVQSSKFKDVRKTIGEMTMKTALIALAIALSATQSQAQQFPITKQQTAPGHASYWQGGQYLGSSHINRATGTETYWPNQAYNYGYQSGCCYNRPFAEGYQMGRDIGTIIRGLMGR